MSPRNSRFALLAATALSCSVFGATETTPLVDTWSASSIEATGESAFMASQSFTIENTGGNLSGTTDAFEFIHTDLSGTDGEIIAQISDFIAADGLQLSTDACAGLMVRTSLDGNSPYLAVFVRGDGITRISFRSSVGGSTGGKNYGVTDYTWFRLQLHGTRLTAYGSNDGQGWTRIDGATVNLGENAKIGTFIASSYEKRVSANLSNLQAFSPKDQDGDSLLDYEEINLYQTSVTSADYDQDGLNDAEELALGSDAWNADSDGDGILDGADLDPLRSNLAMPEGWVSTDIGNTQIAGGVAWFADGLRVSGSGRSMWSEDDAFHYVHTTKDGNFEATVKIDSQTAPTGWAGAGLMLRYGLLSNSSYAMVAATPENGVLFTWRDGNRLVARTIAKNVDLSAPIWLKMQQVGNTVITYTSADGENWTLLGQQTHDVFAPEKTDKLIGLAVGANTNSASSVAEFSNLSITDIIDNDQDGLSDIAESLFYGTSPSLADTDADGKNDAVELADASNPNAAEEPLPEGWQVAELSPDAIAGDAVAYGDTLRVMGTGALSYDQDDHTFLYQELTGDGEIIAQRIYPETTEYNNGGSSVLMMRNDLEAPGISIRQTMVDGWTSFRNRNEAGSTGSAQFYNASGNTFFRLARKGNLVTSYVSADGIEWTQACTTTVPLNDTIYIGIGLVSRDDNKRTFTDFQHVTVRPLMDSDNDGISDLEEDIIYFTDKNAADSDNDGIIDGDEILAGTSPSNAAISIDGDEIHNLGLMATYYPVDFSVHDRVMPDFTTMDPIKVSTLTALDFYTSTWENVNDSGKKDHLAANFQGFLNVPADGEYTFYLNADDAARVKIGEQTLFEMSGANGLDTEVEPVTITLTAGWQPIEVAWYEIGGAAGLKLQWESTNLPKQVITNNYLMHSAQRAAETTLALDSDEDGLLDTFERSIGSDPYNADTNGNGLTDGEAVELGLDPTLLDSDGDGISDVVELFETFTDPTVAEFDGTITTVQTIAGKDASNYLGEWEVKGETIIAKRRRGFVEYELNVTEADIYRLNLEATHNWLKYTCSPVSPIDNSDIQISIDGTFIGTKNLVAPDGIYGQVGFVSPYLTPGTHTVRIHWENVNSRISLQIKELLVQQLGGADSNGDGVKDWVETSVASSAGLDAVPATSYVSPLCVEGKARYAKRATVNGLAVTQGAGERWFANVALHAEGETAIAASFQNGGLTQNATTTWTALNLFAAEAVSGSAQNETDVSSSGLKEITLRVGDSLKLAAGEVVAGTEQPTVQWTLNDELLTADSTLLTQAFTTAGTYTIAATVNGETKSITVEVTGLAVLTETPAVMLGRQRELIIPGLTAEMMVESDDTVKVTRDTNNPEKLLITASETNQPHALIVRSGEGQPILFSSPLNVFWVQNAVDNYFWLVDSFDDYAIWGNTMIVKNLPEDVRVQIRMIIAGPTLDDGTLERWITKTDIDELGEYSFRLIHPNSLNHSACHEINLFQGEHKIGVAGEGPIYSDGL